MTKLIGVLAAATTAAAAVGASAVFYLRKAKSKKQSRWNAAKSSAIAWRRTAAQGAGKAVDRIAGRA